MPIITMPQTNTTHKKHRQLRANSISIRLDRDLDRAYGISGDQPTKPEPELAPEPAERRRATRAFVSHHESASRAFHSLCAYTHTVVIIY